MMTSTDATVAFSISSSASRTKKKNSMTYDLLF